MKQRILFLYLHTGGGHLSGSNALASYISDHHADQAVCLLGNGLHNKNIVLRTIFETGYALTSNYFEIGYVFFYQLTKNPFILKLIINNIMGSSVKKNIIQILKEERITKVICLHELLIPLARASIDTVNPDIPLISLVMDPFTAHYSWFFEKNTELVVFSKKIRQEAIEKYGFIPERVHQFPLMLSQKFDRRYTHEEKKAAKTRHHIPLDKKIVLIAGGGEGLKMTLSIVHKFIIHHVDCYIVVVCGKNKILKTQLELLIMAHQADNIRVFGFISFMPDLMNIADCVITKSGPATVLEVLAAGKPLILASYIRGQELGNMLYVVQNGLGWYIPKTKHIIQKVRELFSDDSLLRTVEKKIEQVHIKNGLQTIAEFIYDFQ